MTRSQFDRKRSRIAHQPKRSDDWRKRALWHLMQEAQARELRQRGEVIGYGLADGQIICMKHRYRDAEAANDELARIDYTGGDHVRPCRAYQCERCHGFHLTSQKSPKRNLS